jgi:hypothetical protein
MPTLFNTGLFAQSDDVARSTELSPVIKNISTFPTRNTRLGFRTNNSKCNHLKVCQRNELRLTVTKENSDIVFLALRTNAQARENKRRHKHITKDNNNLLVIPVYKKWQLPFVDRCINVNNHVLLSLLAIIMLTNIDTTIYNTQYINICIFYILYIILILVGARGNALG